MLLRLRKDFVIRMVVRKEGLIYMLLCEDFVKFDVSTNQKCNRDNSKVSTFFHSDVFIAFGSFLLIWTIKFSKDNKLQRNLIYGKRGRCLHQIQEN